MADQIGTPGTFFADVDGEGGAPERFHALVNAVDAGIFQCDADRHLVAVNDALLAQTGHDRDDLLGQHVSAILDDAGLDRLASVPRGADGGDDATDPTTVRVRTAEGDAVASELRASPLREGGQVRGVAGIVLESPGSDGGTRPSDQSDEGAVRRERAAEQRARLERRREAVESELEEVFERVDDAFYAVDEEFRFTYVNERAEELLQAPEEELLGESVWERYPEATETPAWDAFHEALETQEPTSYEVYFEPLEFWVEASVYPSETGLSVYFRDATERKERERALEESERRYRTLVENFPNGSVTLFDEDLRYTAAGGEHMDRLGLTEDDLVGNTVREALPRKIWEGIEPNYAAALRGETRTFELQYDEKTYQFRAVPVRDDDGEVFAGMGMSQDVTDRKRHERKLEQYRALTQSVNDVIVVIDDESTILSVNPAVEDVFGYEPAVIEDESLTELMAAETAESHRQGLPSYLEEGVKSIDWEYVELTGRTADGETVPVAVSFSESEFGGDRYFTGVVRDITERKERERELERQRMRLAALAHLNGVVQNVTDAVVGRSTREKIERAACERLAASDSYAFAWIADVDPKTQEITPRTEVGVDGYLEAVPLSVDPEETVGRGPTGRAVRTKEMQVSTDVFDDPDFEPWREYAEAYGFRSFAAIPIVHEEGLYGVMGVSSERHGAFADEERDVLGQLGEIVGHGIAAVERKQALMGDEVTELDFCLDDVFAELDVDASTTDRITFERIVPIGGDEHLVFGTATKDDLPVLESLVDALPYWEGLRVVSEDVGVLTYELTVTESRILASVASRGGDVKEAYLEDGDYRITVQVPPSVEVRSIVDVVTDVYPTAELRAQRQVTRTEDGASRVARAFEDELTERQRHVVQSAYFSGYFEWPRESSGEEIAESLDIAPATFSQHLRTAENRIFGALFDDDAGRQARGE